MQSYGPPGGAPPLGYGAPYPPPPGAGGYPPPPPGYGYPPPGYGGRIPSTTEKGVKFFNWSLVLYIIIGLLGFVIAIIALITIPSIASGSSESAIDSAIGMLIMIATIACVLVILALLAFIFFILGIINFNQGKYEFPANHTASVKMGLIFFILAIIMYIIAIIVPFTFGYGIGSDVEKMWDSIRTQAIISAVISMLSGIFVGLMFIYMIKEIAAESDKKLLWLGFLLILIGGINYVSRNERNWRLGH